LLCRRVFSSIFLFVFVFATGIANLVHAQVQGFPPITPEDLHMTSEPKAPGAPAIILYREVDRDDDKYRPHEDNYVRIKILTDEGRKFADVEIPFFKEMEEIDHIHARTYRPDGSEIDFGGEVYEKPLMRARSGRVMAKTFTLTDVQAGSIIEYSYTINFHDFYIYNSNWILSQELFMKDAKFSLKPFQNTTDMVAPFRLRWTWQGLPAGTEPKSDVREVVRMEVHDIPAFEIEDHMPPEDELKSRVDFIYDQELPVKNPAEYWKRYGKKRNQQLEEFLGKRDAMEPVAAQMVAPGDSALEKLRKIYSKVQQVRNTSYEVQKSEEELKRANEKPLQNVSELWKREYGSGAQITWLYLALARAAGLDASGCWVSSRQRFFFKPELMQSAKLNSNVVRVKVDGKDMYFDPGGAFTPFGMLEWGETATQGLCLNKDGGEWVETTLPQADESQIQRNAKLNLMPDGSLKGKLTVTYTGLEAMYRRLNQRHADDAGKKKFLEDQNQEAAVAAIQLELTNQPDWKSSDAPLVAEFSMTVPGWLTGSGHRVLLPATMFVASEKHIFEHANRVNPIYFDYPFTETEDLTVTLPSGWQVDTLPAAKVQDGHILYYSRKAESSPGTVHLTRAYKVDFLLVETKYYAGLRNFYQVVRTGDDAQIVLQPGNAAAGD